MRALAPLLVAASLAACRPALLIRTDREDYAPVMSSAPGLGLSPAPALPAPPGTRWRWRTDFGRFVRWEAPDYKVVELGSDVADAAKVYWTYDPAFMHRDKPDVHVTLDAVDASGRSRARGRLRLHWEGDAAVVTHGIR